MHWHPEIFLNIQYRIKTYYAIPAIICKPRQRYFHSLAPTPESLASFHLGRLSFKAMDSRCLRSPCRLDRPP